MVGRPGKYQPRFTAGELDPLIQANTDEALYFKGASRFENVKPTPQGGFSNRWGTVTLGRARGTLARARPPAGATALVSNLTSPSLAIDNTLGTYYICTPSLVPTPTPVLLIDIGAVVALTFIDLENFAGSPVASIPTIDEPSPPYSTPIGGTVEVDVSPDNVTWTQFGDIFALDAALRTRRFAQAPGVQVNARYIRVVVSYSGPVSPAPEFWLDNVYYWIDQGVPSPIRIRSFTISRETAYDVVFTDQNADVYSSAGYVASIPTTLTGLQLGAALVPAMKNAQQLDTMLCFHQLLPPLRIEYQGSDQDWNADPIPFADIPNWDYGVGYSNGIAAQWQLSFFNFDGGTVPAGGAHYTVAVNGQVSQAIQQPPTDFTGTAAALEAAILALPGVGAGVTVVKTGGSLPTFIITFGGTANQGDGWAVSGDVVDKADAAITAAHIRVGVLGGEPLMSATRGWPSCGCFYGQRLIIAGFLGVPNTFLASETGDYYELDTNLVASSAPMLIPLDTDGAATIVDVHNGRTLDFFCDSGEYWLSTGALDRTVTPVIVKGTTNGIAPTVDAYENEGKTIYAGKEGGALFEFVFNYAEQNYDSNNISISSASLVEDVVDAAMRRLTASTDVNELYCVRGDGEAFMLNLLRQQDITSFARITTDGSWLCVNVNDRFEVTWGVSRLVNGQAVQFVERMVEGVVLDAQQSVSVAAGATSLSGLANHAGATVYAIVDGFVQGPFACSSGGAIALNFAVAANGVALVGRWTPPLVATLPQPRDIAPRTVVRRPCRVHTVRASVVGTSNIAIGANGDGPYDVPLTIYGGLTDIPPMSAPYTGAIVAEGLQGYSEDGIVIITQTRPGLLNVTGVTVEVDL